MEHAPKPAVGARRRGKSTHKKVVSDNGEEKDTDDEETTKEDDKNNSNQGPETGQSQVYPSGAVEKAVDLVEDKATIPSSSRREKSHKKVDTVSSPTSAQPRSTGTTSTTTSGDDSKQNTGTTTTQIYSSGAIQASQLDEDNRVTMPSNRRMKSHKQVDADEDTTTNETDAVESDKKTEDTHETNTQSSAAQIYPSGAVETNYDRSAAIPMRRRKRTVTKKFGDNENDDGDQNEIENTTD